MLFLKSSLIILVLYLFYKIVLEKESFFVQNRFYFLLSLVLTFSLPFIKLPKLVEDQGFIDAKIELITDGSTNLINVTEDNSGSSEPQLTTGASQLSPGNIRSLAFWSLLLYYFGVTIFSFNLLTQVASILIKAMRSKDRIVDLDCIIINTTYINEPCSFFHYIFINPGNYDHDTYEQIISHEKIHVREFHTLDLLLSEIAVIILWFNPIAWQLRKELEKNLEYRTDDLMLGQQQAAKDRYQMNLLKIATFKRPLQVVTNYNQSLIKQRILKMNKRKSNPHTNWKYAFIAPIAFAMLLVINKPLPANAQLGEILSVSETDSKCKELLRAIINEDVAKVERLLDSVDPNCIDSNPENQKIHENNASKIIINGKRTPLVTAAGIGNLPVGKLLLKAGADVNHYATGDETPLMAASSNGHFDFVKFLISNRADVNKVVIGDGTALLVASREGHIETVNYLISKGANINEQVNGDGTPLICAVRSGHYEVAKTLLENGADPELISPGDEYPMYHARMANNSRMINLLRKYESEN